VKLIPPNAKQYFSQDDLLENVSMGFQWPCVDDKKSQEHWKQEELVDKIKVENNKGKDCNLM
jgi:hypothetical protein